MEIMYTICQRSTVPIKKLKKKTILKRFLICLQIYIWTAHDLQFPRVISHITFPDIDLIEKPTELRYHSNVIITTWTTYHQFLLKQLFIHT